MKVRNVPTVGAAAFFCFAVAFAAGGRLLGFARADLHPLGHARRGGNFEHRHGAALARLRARAQIGEHLLHGRLRRMQVRDDRVEFGARRPQVRDSVDHRHAHARMRIAHRRREPRNGIGQPVGRQPHELRGGCAHERIFGAGELIDPRGANHPAGGEHPRCLEVRLVGGGLRPRVRRDPRFDRGHGGGAEFAELNTRVVADDVLGMREQRQQIGRGGALDLRPVFHDRFAGVHDAPDAAARVVPLGIAHRVLRVADDQAGEIGNVERAVETELHIDGAKRAVLRRQHIEAIRRHERPAIGLQRRERHDIAAEERGGGDALLESVGEIRTRNHAEGRALRVVEHRGVTVGMIDAERGPRERHALEDVAAAVALEDISIAVERHLPRIRRHALPLGGDAAGRGIEAVGRGVDAAHDAEGRFKLRAMKHAVGEEQMAERIAGDHAAVVRIRDVDTAQEFGARVGAAVAIGIVQHQQPWLRGDDHAAFVEGHAVERVEAVGEDRGLVRLAVAIGVFEDEDFVARLLAGNRVRKRRHRDDPEATAGVEAQLHRIAQLGKLLLRGEKIHRVAVRHHEFLLHLGRRADGASRKPIRGRLALGQRRERRRGIIGETFRGVGGEVVHDGVGLRDELVVARELGGIFLGALAHAVVERAVFRPHELGDVAVFQGGGTGDFGESRRFDERGIGAAQQRARHRFADHARAGGIEMEAPAR
jgi:hypothetical protein